MNNGLPYFLLGVLVSIFICFIIYIVATTIKEFSTRVKKLEIHIKELSCSTSERCTDMLIRIVDNKSKIDEILKILEDKHMEEENAVND